MEATNIRIKNFKGIDDWVMDLKRITLLFGENGKGKTSLLEAFRTVLTGTIPVCAVRAGETEANVALTFDTGDSLSISITDTGASHYSCGKKVTKKVATELREKILSLPVDVVETLLGSKHEVFSVKPEEFAKMMMELLGVHVDTDKLYDHCGFTKEKTDMLKTVFTGTEIDFDSLEMIFKAIGSRLTQTNREVAELEGVIKHAHSAPPATPLAVLEAQLKDWLQILADAKDCEKRQAAYNTALENRKKYLEDLMRLRNEVSAKKVDQPPRERLIELRTMKDTIAQKLIQLKGTVSSLEKSNSLFEKILDELSSSVCPISKKLVCTTDKTSVRGDLDAQIEANKKQISDLTGEINRADEQLARVSSSITQLEQQETAYLEFVRLNEQYKQKAAGVPELPAPPAVSAGDVEHAQKKVDEINEQISACKSYAAGETARKEYSAKSEEALMLNSLKADFAPKGLAYNILFKAIETSLTSSINETAELLHVDVEYAFAFNSGLHLLARKKGAPNYIPVKAMSDGEQFISQLLLLNLICQTSHLGILVLDNMDSLDAGNTKRVIDLINTPAFKGGYQTILLAGINHTDTMEALQDLLKEPDVVAYTL